VATQSLCQCQCQQRGPGPVTRGLWCRPLRVSGSASQLRRGDSDSESKASASPGPHWAVLTAKPQPQCASAHCQCGSGSCRRPADGLGLGGHARPELERSVAAARARRGHWHCQWQCAGGPAGTMPNDAACLPVKAACSLPGRPSQTLRKSRRVCLRLSVRLKLANSDPEDLRVSGACPGKAATEWQPCPASATGSALSGPPRRCATFELLLLRPSLALQAARLSRRASAQLTCTRLRLAQNRSAVVTITTK
jgi:hypothetical protein